MTNSRKGSSFDEDLKEQLKDPEFASEYIVAALEENDMEFLKTALLDVIKAQGVSNISEDSEVNRQSIYRMLSPEGNPTLSNLAALLDSAGLTLTVRPKKGA